MLQEQRQLKQAEKTMDSERRWDSQRLISLSPTDVNISRCDKKTNPEIVERPVILVNDATISPKTLKKHRQPKIGPYYDNMRLHIEQIWSPN